MCDLILLIWQFLWPVCPFHGLCVKRKQRKLCRLRLSDVLHRPQQCKIHLRRPWALLSLFILSAYMGREIISCISSNTTSSVILSPMLRMTCPIDRDDVFIIKVKLTCMFLQIQRRVLWRDITFLYVPMSLAVDLSVLIRIQAQHCSSQFQVHSIIFPEYTEISDSPASFKQIRMQNYSWKKEEETAGDGRNTSLKISCLEQQTVSEVAWV